MKLQQLRYIWEIAHHDLNVSATAQSLFTSQPGISKQVRLLEDELGVQIFARSGKHLTHVTPAGEMILDLAGQILRKTESIKRVAHEFSDETSGNLSIATTHTQARYILPEVVRIFQTDYPNVSLVIKQGTPHQVVQMAAEGKVDFVVATISASLKNKLITLPCYRWNPCLVVPKGHSLTNLKHCSLEAISEHPIVTYTTEFTGRSRVDDAFKQRNLIPNLVFSAVDSDVIKTYVRVGFGIGLIAGFAYDELLDHDLVKIDASHLFSSSVTSLAFRAGTFLRSYMHGFIGELAPHLERELVLEAVSRSNVADRAALFKGIELPSY